MVKRGETKEYLFSRMEEIKEYIKTLKSTIQTLKVEYREMKDINEILTNKNKDLLQEIMTLRERQNGEEEFKKLDKELEIINSDLKIISDDINDFPDRKKLTESLGINKDNMKNRKDYSIVLDNIEANGEEELANHVPSGYKLKSFTEEDTGLFTIICVRKGLR